MNITKKDRNIKPSDRVRTDFESPLRIISLARISKTIAARRLKGISILTVLPCTAIGLIRAAIPIIRKTLNVLLPITFPMASSVFPEVEDKMLTISSGAEVPKATTVSPMVRAEIPNLSAMLDAPSTSHTAPKISNANPTIINKEFKNIVQ